MIRFGGREAAKESFNVTRVPSPWSQCSAQDLRYALRTMKREPGFTVFAILIVALGIGASATVFSVLNTCSLQPLPFHEPGATPRSIAQLGASLSKDYPARHCRYCTVSSP